MEKLISTDNLILKIEGYNFSLNWKWNKILTNTKFLNKKLELRYFIATDKEGNVLEEPEHYKSFLKVRHTNKAINDLCEQYQEAKERVLFKDCKCYENKTGYLILNKKLFDFELSFYRNGKCRNAETIQDLVGLDIELFNTLKQ